jgi:CPA1 family monovalent cation:H+ antiporter
VLGLSLPWVVRRLGLSRNRKGEEDAERAEELDARTGALLVAWKRLDELTDERRPPAEVLDSLNARHVARAEQPAYVGVGAELRSELIDAERRHIFQLLREGKLNDESRRRLERELDLEETSLAHRARRDEPPL